MPNRLITCEKCKGGGKLDSKEGKPWRDITYPTPNPDVASGAITPVICPDCGGTGTIEAQEVEGDAKEGQDNNPRTPAQATPLPAANPIPAPAVTPAPTPAPEN